MFVRDHPSPVEFARRVRRKSSASGLPSDPVPRSRCSQKRRRHPRRPSRPSLEFKANRAARPGKEKVPGFPVSSSPTLLKAAEHRTSRNRRRGFKKFRRNPSAARHPPTLRSNPGPQLHGPRRFACPPLPVPIKLDCWRMMREEAHDEHWRPTLMFAASISWRRRL